jgi:hypothetical protein
MILLSYQRTELNRTTPPVMSLTLCSFGSRCSVCRKFHSRTDYFARQEIRRLYMNIDVGSDKPQIERVANEDAYGIRSPVHRQEKRPRSDGAASDKSGEGDGCGRWA